MGKDILIEHALKLAKEDKIDEALQVISQFKGKSGLVFDLRVNGAREIYEHFMSQGRLKDAIPFAAILIEKEDGRYKLCTSIIQKLLKGSSPEEITQAVLKATQLLLQASSCSDETIKALKHLYDDYLKLPQLFCRLMVYNDKVAFVDQDPALKEQVKFAYDTVERAKILLKKEHRAMTKNVKSSATGLADVEELTQREILKKCFLLDHNFGFDPYTIL